MQNNVYQKKLYKQKIQALQKSYIEMGLHVWFMKQYYFVQNFQYSTTYYLKKGKIAFYCVVLFAVSCFCGYVLSGLYAVRCLLPSNYLVWEATRPFADCSYCQNVTKPLILRNVTRKSFQKYAYSPRPIIVKNSISYWKAKTLTFETFEKLYKETPGSYESLDDGCQFLNFKTDLFSLKEVFEMPKARVKNEEGEKPWYVGWGNCHPDILKKLREFYSIPHFLPKNAEFPATENIFMGYEMGAVMHLDYITRLMWQGQVKGNKTWKVAPVPECEDVCQPFKYYVEPGDVVLLDTRIWYHSTRIPKGQFSLTVQSEYG